MVYPASVGRIAIGTFTPKSPPFSHLSAMQVATVLEVLILEFRGQVRIAVVFRALNNQIQLN